MRYLYVTEWKLRSFYLQRCWCWESLLGLQLKVTGVHPVQSRVIVAECGSDAVGGTGLVLTVVVRLDRVSESLVVQLLRRIGTKENVHRGILHVLLQADIHLRVCLVELALGSVGDFKDDSELLAHAVHVVFPWRDDIELVRGEWRMGKDNGGTQDQEQNGHEGASVHAGWC